MARSGALLAAILGGLAATGLIVAVALPLTPESWHTAWLVWAVAGVAVALSVAMTFREPAPPRD